MAENQSYYVPASSPWPIIGAIGLGLIAWGAGNTVIELKYFKGSSKEEKADMFADLAKVERIVESKTANEGFCIQLMRSGVHKRMHTGPVTKGHYELRVGRWAYDFLIKGNYSITPEIQSNERALVVHHVTRAVIS